MHRNLKRGILLQRISNDDIYAPPTSNPRFDCGRTQNQNPFVAVEAVASIGCRRFRTLRRQRCPRRNWPVDSCESNNRRNTNGRFNANQIQIGGMRMPILPGQTPAKSYRLNSAKYPQRQRPTPPRQLGSGSGGSFNAPPET